MRMVGWGAQRRSTRSGEKKANLQIAGDVVSSKGGEDFGGNISGLGLEFGHLLGDVDETDLGQVGLGNAKELDNAGSK